MKTDQFTGLVNTLMQKTAAKKVPWQITSVSNSYLCVLAGGIAFILQHDGHRYHLVMKDGSGRDVRELSAAGPTESDPERTSMANDAVYEMLRELYEGAQRQAHEAANRRAQEFDRNLGMAKSALDRL